MTEALDATEAYSASKSTHPRVSLADIQADIDYQMFLQDESLFISLGHASVEHSDGSPPSTKAVNSLKLLTICLLVMRNGFTIVGKSAPASPENYDAEKGRTFAYEDAIRQAWPLMGYALRDKLAKG